MRIKVHLQPDIGVRMHAEVVLQQADRDCQGIFTAPVGWPINRNSISDRTSINAMLGSSWSTSQAFNALICFMGSFVIFLSGKLIGGLA